MRYEGKTEQDAVEAAARALGKPAAELKYAVIRDEKSFWGGRVVEIEVEEDGGRREAGASRDACRRRRETRRQPRGAPGRGAAASARASRSRPARRTRRRSALVEATLTELLSAAGLLVEIAPPRAAGDEMLFELIGDDVEPLLANKGEGLSGPGGPGGPHRRPSAWAGPSIRDWTPKGSARTARRRSRSSRAVRRGGPPHAAARSCCRRSRPGNAAWFTWRSPRTRRSRPRAKGTGS